MTIELAFCIDDNFAPYFATCVNSIKSHSRDSIRIHVIGCLSHKVTTKLLRLESDNVQLNFIDNVPNFDKLSVSHRYGTRLNQVTYWRFALADLLPNVSKVLYLDADILVVSDLAPLWNIGVDDVYAAVVKDHSLMAQNYHDDLDEGIGAYFNAGMMLINLDLWRNNKIKQKLIQTFETRSYWEFNDQDVLNIVLNENVCYIDDSYNSQTYTIQNGLVDVPVVVHFTGQEKPWHASSHHPYTNEFREHLNTTPFKDIKFDLALDSEDYKILETLKRKLPHGGTLAMWGVGARGRRLSMSILTQQPQYRLKYLIDRAFEGSWLDIPVYKPDNIIMDDIDALIIATVPWRQQIINALKNPSYVVI